MLLRVTSGRSGCVPVGSPLAEELAPPRAEHGAREALVRARAGLLPSCRAERTIKQRDGAFASERMRVDGDRPISQGGGWRCQYASVSRRYESKK